MLGLGPASTNKRKQTKYNIFKNDKITNQEETEVSTAQNVGGAFIEIAYRDAILPKMRKCEPSSSASSAAAKAISTAVA